MQDHVPFMETDRLKLRALDLGDVGVWFQWFNDPEVTHFMNKGTYPNTDSAQIRFLESISESRTDIQFAIVSKKLDEFIGTIGIHKIDWIHRHGDLSILIGVRAYWGQGVGTEAIGAVVRHAFTKLNFHKLTAGMWSVNVSSRKAFEKNGFTEEGDLREQYFFEDRYVDEVRLGLLQLEWAKNERDQGV